VSDIVVPKKFRVSEFVKYVTMKCPNMHLRSYYNKITKVIRDEKFLIHFFQDSLIGSALSWYMTLDNTRVKKWSDFADIFLKQYKFNIDISLNRTSLMVVEKRNKKIVREYAYRWNNKPIHIQPSLLEKGMVTLFANTFKSSYYEHLMGSCAQYFYDVVIAEKIE
jgi:hypothetical protein